MGLGDKLKQVRLSKGLAQKHITDHLGYASTAYYSDIELGKFIPKEDKLYKIAEALGLTKSEIDELVTEAKLEELGISDPSFTMLFKDIPNMTQEEKQSVIRSYQGVLKARHNKK